MKVNLQKTIVLIAVSAIIISILNISAFATSEPSAMTVQEFYAAQSDVVDKWVNGDITYSEWYERQNSILDEFYSTNQSVGDSAYATALAIGERFRGVSQKVSNAVEQWGDGARERVKDWWNNVCNNNNVPTETTQTPSTDIGGYGALAVVTRVDNGKNRKDYYYSDSIIVYDDDSNTLFSQNSIGNPHYKCYVNGNLIYDYDSSYSSTFSKFSFGTNYSVQYYGDVRYQDGTQAPTDDEFITGTIKKFDDMPEKDLDDLLNDFSEEMERQNPDLSSIEGLLNAIYARLGSLDSDNDNQLLSEILTAIKAIKSTETDNTELLELLEDIKNALVFGDDENKENFIEQLEKLIDNQITRDDFVIDEDLYNNHGEILKERLLGKFSFIYNMKTFVTYCFDEYSNTSESPEFEIEYNGKSHSINFSVFDEYLPTIQWILAAFIYLTYAYHTYRKIPSYINGGDNE